MNLLVDNIITVSTQVAILFILVFIGFTANKIKIFSLKTIKEITNFVLYIVVRALRLEDRDFFDSAYM